MQYVYQRTEPGVYTVGFHDEKGHWQPDSDHATTKEAADRAAYLNGTPVHRFPLAEIRLMQCWTQSSPHPWTLDTNNANEIIVRDARGEMVFFHDAGDAPEGIPAHVIETANRQASANARLMVAMSEALIGSVQ